jgi:SM-20-related protein
VLSVVGYLNPYWSADDDGELIIYLPKALFPAIIGRSKVTVILSFATIAVFLSAKYPHEVLPALRNCYAIAAWFRLNSSMANTIAPSR